MGGAVRVDLGGWVGAPPKTGIALCLIVQKVKSIISRQFHLSLGSSDEFGELDDLVDGEILGSSSLGTRLAASRCLLLG